MVKNQEANAGDMGVTPELGRSLREGNPLQCSCLGNPMNRGAWWGTVLRVVKSLTLLSDYNNNMVEHC